MKTVGFPLEVYTRRKYKSNYAVSSLSMCGEKKRDLEILEENKIMGDSGSSSRLDVVHSTVQIFLLLALTRSVVLSFSRFLFLLLVSLYTQPHIHKHLLPLEINQYMWRLVRLSSSASFHTAYPIHNG